jgi:hypothetical protein
MLYGRVKFFNAEKGREFGFLQTPDGDRFFHRKYGEFILAGENGPEFCGQTMRRDGKVLKLAHPKQGDYLVYAESLGFKGVIARPWGFKAMYDRALKAVLFRSTPTIFRALETRKSLGDKKPGEPIILWQGSDLKELLLKYPRPVELQAHGSDPLLPYWSDEDNSLEIRRCFERLNGGVWQRCNDPRF